MDVRLISLIVFVSVIALAFILKSNTGLLAIIAAVALALIYPEVPVFDKATQEYEIFKLASELFNLFDGKMFLMLLGIMFLFGIAEENKTLDLLAKKVINLCGGKVQLLPIMLFILSAVISGVGPGLISATALMAVISVALAKQVGVHPLKLLPFGTLGSFAFGLSPLTPSGAVAITKAEAAGITGLEWPLLWQMALVIIAYTAILYFFVFKWHKIKGSGSANSEKTDPFSWKQWATLAGIAITAVMALIFKDSKILNVGMIALPIGILLTVIGAADESKVLKRVPWGTLILITGVGLLIGVVEGVGGIALLQEWLEPLMKKSYIASPIMTGLAGAMSWFSSASGVVMPTLIPVSAKLATAIPELNAIALSVCVCVGAHMAALSPMSTCGGLMLAAYTSGEGVDAKARDKMFAQLFIMSASGVAFAAVAFCLLSFVM